MRHAVPIVVALGLAACSKNSPPELIPIDPQTAHVGSRFELKLMAHDPDGDRIQFDYSSPTLSLGSDRARLYDLGGEAIFSWTPIASEVGSHQLDFTVSDGDLTDRESVVIVVKASTNPDTAPVFRKPLGEGTTLDLATSQCLQLDVLVEDPDSVSVDISQDPVIEGSTLQSTGPLQARFSWCPTTAQAASSVFILRLVADDHENTVVRKNFTILVRTDLPRNCPGSAPSIQHTPPADQKTLDPIKLTATITDDKGLKGDPTVYYTETKPPDPAKLDYGSMDQVALQLVTGQTTQYEATLPNPTSALKAGESATLYYVIVAQDDDDPAGSCDHRTQLPASDTFQLKVTRPQDVISCTTSAQCKANQMCQSQSCVTDSCTPQDTNGDKLYWEQSTCPTGHICPVNGLSATSHCAQTCTSDSDCKVPGAACKVFDTKDACGQAGTKLVGQDCTDFTQCATKAMCLPWTGGYCSISDCDSYGGFSGPCPAGAACVPLPDTRFSMSKHWLCLQLCKDNTNCRPGYTCKTITDDQSVSRKVCLE